MQNCFELFIRLFNSLSRGFSFARLGFLLAIFSAALVTTGCTSAVDDTQRAWMNRIFRPYVPDVVQGNFISSEQYAKLKLDMSREQVRQVMGTPLLADYFHANRWDYIFEFKRAGQKVAKERRVTIFFEDDKVSKFDGDALPTEVELVAEIDNYAKQKRSFWEVITGSNKAPITIPLQQPELLVPSPTNNLPADALNPAPVSSNTNKSSFWSFLGFSIKQPEAQAVKQSEVLGPGALNTSQASEVK